jgi:hypothetical protein
MLGFVIALSTMSLAGRYVSLFLMACGYVGECDPSCFDYVCHLYFSISRVCNESCVGIERHPTASSVSKVILYVFGGRLCLSRKRAAAIGIVNGFGNVGSVYEILKSTSQTIFLFSLYLA